VPQGSPDDVIQTMVALLSWCTPLAVQTVKTPCIKCLATCTFSIIIIDRVKRPAASCIEVSTEVTQDAQNHMATAEVTNLYHAVLYYLGRRGISQACSPSSAEATSDRPIAPGY